MGNVPPDAEVLTVKEAAAKLRVCERTMYSPAPGSDRTPD
jgi:hypothetical protein